MGVGEKVEAAKMEVEKVEGQGGGEKMEGE